MAIVGFIGRAISAVVSSSVGGASQFKEFGPQRVATGVSVQASHELAAAFGKLRGPLAAESMANALYRQAEKIMTASKRQVPVDTGNLRATGHVEPPKFPLNERDISVVLAFGGTAGARVVRHTTDKATNKKVTLYRDEAEVGYAVYVHEDLRAFHKVGNAKYLERPLLEAANGLESRLAADLRRDIEGAARGK